MLSIDSPGLGRFCFWKGSSILVLSRSCFKIRDDLYQRSSSRGNVHKIRRCQKVVIHGAIGGIVMSRDVVEFAALLVVLAFFFFFFNCW